MKEIRWQSGKEEYTKKEIEYMLESQRAMIHNDISYLLYTSSMKKGVQGEWSEEGKDIMSYLKNPRTVDI